MWWGLATPVPGPISCSDKTLLTHLDLRMSSRQSGILVGSSMGTLVVVEFNDMQCPACNKHAIDAQPSIDQSFIDTGKVLWVDKHLPLRIHKYAPLEAVAAECAGNQQKYWDIHHLLHEKSENWTNDNAESALRALARELPLDMPAFLGCFNSREGLERVL